MKTFILGLLVILIPTTYAEDQFLEFGDKTFASEKLNKSKWYFKLGADYMEYISSLPEYDGINEDIEEDQKEYVTGLGLAFGRDLYFGGGVSANLGISGSYWKTLQEDVGKATEDFDFDAANYRRSYSIAQLEVHLGLNYLFQVTESVYLQPFVEGAAGAGTARVEREYERVEIEAGNDEYFDYVTEEIFTTARASLGLNVISFNGLMSYFKVSSIIYTVSERETTGDSKLAGSDTITTFDEKEEDLADTNTVLMASVGIGYMF